MAVEQGHQEGDIPKEVYETIDGTPLQGTLREVHPELFQGKGLSLEDAMESPTVLGEALRCSFAKLQRGVPYDKAITAVAATKKPAGK